MYLLPVRIRLGAREQARFQIRAPSESEAQSRYQRLRDLALELVHGGRHPSELKIIVGTLAETADSRDFTKAETAVRKSLSRPAPKTITFQELGEEWTSGRLHQRYPDQVRKKKSADDDANRLAHLNKTVGSVPIHLFTLADAERAMANLPETSKASATRRHYAQVMAKLLRFAVYPLKLIKASPLPEGFLPPIRSNKAKGWLYPEEDQRLLGHVETPLDRRVLWGFLAREGLRLGEALALTWGDLDLDRGSLRLDNNKTDDPRAWALDPGVTKALAAYRALRGGGPRDRVFVVVDDGALARVLRGDLRAAQVDRPELSEHTETRLQMRVHDLRGTFVTLSLASGKTETWVSDRTGHKSSVMINRYRRAARTAEELGVGTLLPLHEALPEFKPKGSKGSPEGVETEVETEPSKGGTPSVLASEESSQISLVPKKGVEPSRGVASADFESAASAIPPLRLAQRESDGRLAWRKR